MNMMPFMVVAQATGNGGGIVGMFGGLVGLAITVLIIVGFWKVFTKANEPGWASIIPIYNVFVLLRIVGRPAWWLILFLIPFVNFIIWVVVSVDVAKSFGKGIGFAIGLMILPMFCYPALGFGSATYQGPSAA